MNNKATEAIEPYLEPGEALIWTGQPKEGVVFEVADVFKSLYMILWLLVGWFIVKPAFFAQPLLAVPIASFFIAVFLLLGIARFFIDAALRKKTFYGLTDKRIIIISNAPFETVRSVYLDQKPKIDFLPNMDDTATIDLGIGVRTRGMWIVNVKACTSLYRLTDGDVAHRKIRELLAAKQGV